MKAAAWKTVALVLAVAACAGACARFPTRAVYRSPAISSVAWFPQIIGQGDSLLVTISATDPDGDELLYDWETDTRLVIKGAPSVVYLFSSPNNSQIFYRSAMAAGDDTVRISCYVRDGKGGVDAMRIRVPLRD